MAKTKKKAERRECAVCGKKFTPAVSNQRYCSAKCKAAMKAKVAKSRRASAEPKKVKAVEKISLEKKAEKKRTDNTSVSQEYEKLFREAVSQIGLFALAMFKTMQNLDRKTIERDTKGKTK